MSNDEITSEHNAARIGQLLEELEALRLEMGRTRDARVPMHVSDASPREVYYHAQTVYRKANRLCAELGGDRVDPPYAAVAARAHPSDVLALIEGARARLAVARALLRIDGDSFQPAPPGSLPRDAGKAPSDVLAGCLVASRQLNAMLEHAFGAREAREQLIRALRLAGRLLAVHGAELPAAPPHERRKFPRDVFQVLWRACETLHRLLTDSGVRSLAIHRGFVGEEPTDVYDIASLIVSELEYLASFFPAENAPSQAEVPVLQAPVLPAHNFRLAVQFEAAMEALAGAARVRPNWLRDARGQHQDSC